MTKDNLIQRVSDTLASCADLVRAGQSEYTPNSDNPFANFSRIGDELGLSREQVLLVFARKHWDGIISWVGGHRSQREKVGGRIRDLIVYLALLEAMTDANESIQTAKVAVYGGE